MNKMSYAEWLQVFHKDYSYVTQCDADWLSQAYLLEEYDKWCREEYERYFPRKKQGVTESPRPKFQAGALVQGAYHNGNPGGPWTAQTGLVIETGLASPAAEVAAEWVSPETEREPYAQVLWPDGQTALVAESDLMACKNPSIGL